MGVYIKDMKTPRNCYHCPLGQYWYEQRAIFCVIKKDYVAKNIEWEMKEDLPKPNWCPLVEIPTPHGRLIDIERKTAPTPFTYFKSKGKRMPEFQRGWNTCLDSVHQAPTVIEAEE